MVGNGAYRGIAPGVRVINVKVLDGDGKGTVSSVVAGLAWVVLNKATYKIGVINMSLGKGYSSEKAVVDSAVRYADDAVALEATLTPLMEDIEFSRRLKRTGPTAALHQTVITSFRRWEQQGPLRTIVLMWTLRFLYWAGVSPSRLSRWYNVVR